MSKLTIVTSQLNDICNQLQNEDLSKQDVQKLIQIIKELVTYVSLLQDECIKVLQSRQVEKDTTKIPFAWESLRQEVSPFKINLQPFNDV